MHGGLAHGRQSVLPKEFSFPFKSCCLPAPSPISPPLSAWGFDPVSTVNATRKDARPSCLPTKSCVHGRGFANTNSLPCQQFCLLSITIWSLNSISFTRRPSLMEAGHDLKWVLKIFKTSNEGKANCASKQLQGQLKAEARLLFFFCTALPTAGGLLKQKHGASFCSKRAGAEGQTQDWPDFPIGPSIAHIAEKSGHWFSW